MIKNHWVYTVCKILIVVFVNSIIYFILQKNDVSSWYSRAIAFYNLRNPEAYDFISDIPIPNNPQQDIRDPTRYTEMEDRLHRMQNNILSRRFILYNGNVNYDGDNSDLGFRLTI